MTVRSLIMSAAGMGIRKSTAVLIGASQSPFIHAYRWDMELGGLVSKYANPASLPSNNVNGVAFSPKRNAVAAAAVSGSAVMAWRWSDFIGFYTRYPDPPDSPSAANDIAFSPRGDAVLAAVNGSLSNLRAAVYGWRWSVGDFDQGGFGESYGMSGITPSGSPMQGVAFNRKGNLVASMASNNSPYIQIRAWTSANGFGAGFSDPATLPASGGLAVSFSPKGGAVVAGLISSPRMVAYRISESAFGPKLADPSALPPNSGRGLSFSPSGRAIAVAHDTSPYVTVYRWLGDSIGFGAKYSNPLTLPAGGAWASKFDAEGKALLVAGTGTPNVSVYEWDDEEGFGVRLSSAVALPTGGCYSASFN